MGCRIPLTETDTRHHPAQNFEKPFGSWPKAADRRGAMTGWVGCSPLARAPGRPRGRPARSEAPSPPCEAASRPSGTGRLRRLRADAPLARERARARVERQLHAHDSARPSGERTSPTPPGVVHAATGPASTRGAGRSRRPSQSAAGRCRRRAGPRARDPCDTSRRPAARSAGARRSAASLPRRSRTSSAATSTTRPFAVRSGRARPSGAIALRPFGIDLRRSSAPQVPAAATAAASRRRRRRWRRPRRGRPTRGTANGGLAPQPSAARQARLGAEQVPGDHRRGAAAGAGLDLPWVPAVAGPLTAGPGLQGRPRPASRDEGLHAAGATATGIALPAPRPQRRCSLRRSANLFAGCGDRRRGRGQESSG